MVAARGRDHAALALFEAELQHRVLNTPRALSQAGRLQVLELAAAGPAARACLSSNSSVCRTYGAIGRGDVNVSRWDLVAHSTSVHSDPGSSGRQRNNWMPFYLRGLRALRGKHDRTEVINSPLRHRVGTVVRSARLAGADRAGARQTAAWQRIDRQEQRSIVLDGCAIEMASWVNFSKPPARVRPSSRSACCSAGTSATGSAGRSAHSRKYTGARSAARRGGSALPQRTARQQVGQTIDPDPARPAGWRALFCDSTATCALSSPVPNTTR